MGKSSKKTRGGTAKSTRHANKGPMAWAGAAHSFEQAKTPQAIAQTFNASVPMQVRQDKHESGDDSVRADQPTDLRVALGAGLQAIHPAVLKGNATLLLEWFEHVIIEHVLSRQADNKALAHLLQRDPKVEAADPKAKGKRYGGGRLSKSSWVGRDPFGDRKPPAPASGTKERAQQLLLQDVQDACYQYARVHVHALLDPEISACVQEHELAYLDSASKRNATPRKRITWDYIRTTILAFLQEGTGLHELACFLHMRRERDESASTWAKRVRVARRVLRALNLKLSTAMWQQKLLQYLTKRERQAVIETHRRDRQLEHAAMRGPMKPLPRLLLTYRNEVRAMAWSVFYEVCTRALPTESKYNPSMHDAVARRSTGVDREAGGQAGAERAMRSDKGNSEHVPGECTKCKRAGLSGRAVKHDYRKCDPDRRAAAVARLASGGKGDRGRQRKRAKRDRNSDGSQREARNRRGDSEGQRQSTVTGQQAGQGHAVRFVEKRNGDRGGHTRSRHCSVCESAGRRHDRHDTEQCHYRKGGIWYGLEGDALRAAKERFYAEVKARKRKTTKATKRTRVEQESGEDEPHWQMCGVHQTVLDPLAQLFQTYEAREDGRQFTVMAYADHHQHDGYAPGDGRYHPGALYRLQYQHGVEEWVTVVEFTHSLATHEVQPVVAREESVGPEAPAEVPEDEEPVEVWIPGQAWPEDVSPTGESWAEDPRRAGHQGA